jgi:dTDP-4-amino-4,6-dideoxygalactose transaminase
MERFFPKEKIVKTGNPVRGDLIRASQPVYHTFVLQTDHRDDLRQHLADNGIGSAIHYPVPIHLQPAAAYLGYKPGDFPVAERQARRQLSIPVHHGLSDAQADRVIDVIREWARTQ